MIRIIDEHGTGKTYKLFLLSKANKAIIVCKQPEILVEKANKYEIFDLKIISYKDFLEKEDFNDNLYLIDELENFIHYIFNNKNRKILGYTLSIE